MTKVDFSTILPTATSAMTARAGDVLLLTVPEGLTPEVRDHVAKFLNRTLADTGIIGLVFTGSIQIVGALRRDAE